MRIKSEKGQAIVELGILLTLLLILMSGVIFYGKCIDIRTRQLIAIRNKMFTADAVQPEGNIILNNINSFLSGLVLGELISTGNEEIEVPLILAEAKIIEFKSSIYLLRNSWNTREFVDMVWKTDFGTGSVNEIRDVIFWTKSGN